MVEVLVMTKLVGKYSAFLLLGIIIVLVSLGVGAYRTANQATLSQLEFGGDTTSSEYRAALTTEEVLKRYSEIIPLIGLGFLKLGIGFAIATIVMNLRATGESARSSFKKAGQEIHQMRPPFFARNFARFLVLGILIELVAVIVMIGWMFTGMTLIDLRFAGEQGSPDWEQIALLDKTFGILAEPLEGLGVAFLIGGIAFGLATIVGNLGMQAAVLPEKLKALVSGSKEAAISRPPQVVPKKWLRVTILGMLITASGLIPLALVRVYSVHQGDKVLEKMIAFTWETWMFVGIATLLFSIGFWLLIIIKYLRAQRSNLNKSIGEIIAQKAPPIESPLGITKAVPYFLVAGLLWMLVFFWVFNVLRAVAGFNVLNGPVLEQDFIAQNTLGMLVRPGKAIGLALLFTGIGLALMTIVINLRLTAFMLPGAFAKIVNAIKGERPEAEMQQKESMLSMSVATRKLFLGILIGVIIVVIGTFPLALTRMANAEVYLAERFSIAGASADFDVSLLSAGAQQALQTQLMLEHFIGPWVAVGIGTIFFLIGKFFGTIVGFVKGRRQLISEGVESAVYYAVEATKSTKRKASSSARTHGD